MLWTDERIELLKKLWSDGLSGSQIATQLGGITRNAVIGKVHRLGLSGRAKSSSTAAPRTCNRKQVQDKLKNAWLRTNAALALEQEVARDAFEPSNERRTLLELTEHTCRWPFGHPGKANFFYCGGNTISGLPYCSYHSRIAYQPIRGRLRERQMVHG
ncbi:MAG: GcrA cell cycle regulator [Patescibacteria group bacterium]|nr:GcrA cell cycle regulator [Patescibacteria group bacterium]